nr:hypothetical protein [Candidatus Sigynarchaeum springense]
MIQDRFLIEEDTAERFVAICRRANGITFFAVVLLGVAGSFFLYLGYLVTIIFTMFGLIGYTGVVLWIIARIKYWRRLVIDSVNKSISVEGNFLPRHKLSSTTFDGIKNIQISRERNAGTIWIVPNEGPAILVAQIIPLDQTAFLMEQLGRRTGLPRLYP